VEEDSRKFQIATGEVLRRHLESPPAGSAAARARAFGLDIFATARKLALTTVEERLRRLDQRIDDMRALRRSLR
jgi:hypothetical protein